MKKTQLPQAGIPTVPRKRPSGAVRRYIERNRIHGHCYSALVDFEDFSLAGLLSIIKLDSIDENEGYIDHLNTIAKGFEHGQNSDRG